MSNNPIIKRLNDTSFVVEHNDNRKDKLLLDFNPIIVQFKLNTLDRFCLHHWQAKPKGKREWGIYCSKTKRYYSHGWDEFTLIKPVSVQTLQLDENRFLTIPSAVILYVNTSVGEEVILANK